MDYLQKARDHSIQWSIDSKGDQEFIFDKIGLEYFLDSLNIDFLVEPKKEWVDLTDEEISDVQQQFYKLVTFYDKDFARAIEAKLKEKNT